MLWVVALSILVCFVIKEGITFISLNEKFQVTFLYFLAILLLIIDYIINAKILWLINQNNFLKVKNVEEKKLNFSYIYDKLKALLVFLTLLLPIALSFALLADLVFKKYFIKTFFYKKEKFNFYTVLNIKLKNIKKPNWEII